MYKLRMPTEKQLKLAVSLGLRVEDKSFRVLSAEISDAIELKSFKIIESENIRAGMEVQYIGSRDDIPKNLVVSTVAKNGFIYFKGTHKYCRPWDVKVIKIERKND